MADLSVVSSQPLPGGSLQVVSSQPLARRDSVSDAFSGFVDGAKSVITSIPGAVAHPLDSIHQLWDTQKAQFSKAVDSARQGDYDLAAGHLAGGVLPIAGPMAADFLQAAADGKEDGYDLGKRMGQIVTVKALPEATSKAIEAAPAIVAGVKAAAPDLAAGLGKMAAGEVLGKLPGGEWPARWQLTIPGAKQIGKGITTGYQAGKAALADDAPAPGGMPTADAAKAIFQKRIDEAIAQQPYSAARAAFARSYPPEPVEPGISQPINPATGAPASNGAMAMNSQGGPAAAIAAPPGIYQAQPRPASDLAPKADVNGRVIPMGPVTMDERGPFVQPEPVMDRQTARPTAAPKKAARAPAPAAAPTAAPVPETYSPKYDNELLDSLSQWAFKKDFKALKTDAERNSVLSLADQGVTKAAAAPAPTPAPVPTPTPAPVPPPTPASAPEPAADPPASAVESVPEEEAPFWAAQSLHYAADAPEPAAASMEAAEKHPAHAANAVIAADRWAANLKSLAVAAPALDDSAAWGKLAEGLDERPGYAPSIDTREMIRERLPEEPSELEKQLTASLALRAKSKAAFEKAKNGAKP